MQNARESYGEHGKRQEEADEAIVCVWADDFRPRWFESLRQGDLERERVRRGVLMAISKIIAMRARPVLLDLVTAVILIALRKRQSVRL